MPSNTTIKNQINRDLGKGIPTYCPEIPLDDIFQIISNHGGTVIQEDGTAWSGLLCGAEGETSFVIAGLKNIFLRLSWYKMQSGKYEIITYVS